MRHRRRSLTIVHKVGAVMVAVVWAVSRREVVSSVAVILLAALSLIDVRGRPRRSRSPAVVVSNLAAALALAIVIDRAFVPTVLAIWAGLTGVAALTRVFARPTVRDALFRGLRGRQAEPNAGQVVTTGR